MRVGADARKRAEASRHDLDGIEWRALDRRHARIRRDSRVSLVAVVDRRASAQQRILAAPGMRVVFRDRVLEPLRVDAAIAGELRDGAAGLEVPGPQERSDGQRCGTRHAETVAPLEFARANEPRCDFFAVGYGPQ